MPEQFSKLEKIAGLFVLLSLAGIVGFSIFLAVKQGWFLQRYSFKTKIKQGDGLHPGTSVQMMGLRAGTIEKVSITEDNKIEVSFNVGSDFAKKIREDSLARVIRPFIIGEKALEITPGSLEARVVRAGGELNSEETMDLMDLLGGGHLGPYLKTLDALLTNLQFLATAFSDPRRSEALVGIFDQTLPTLIGFRDMTEQMTKRKNLAKTLQQTAELLPHVKEFSKNLPALGQDGVKVMAELRKTTEDLNKILPALAQFAPQVPEMGQKSVEAVREALTVLKAMQRSFLLRSSVKEVKEEEELQKQQREPASK